MFDEIVLAECSSSLSARGWRGEELRMIKAEMGWPECVIPARSVGKVVAVWAISVAVWRAARLNCCNQGGAWGTLALKTSKQSQATFSEETA